MGSSLSRSRRMTSPTLACAAAWITQPLVHLFHQAGRPLGDEYAAEVEGAAAQGVPRQITCQTLSLSSWLPLVQTPRIPVDTTCQPTKQGSSIHTGVCSSGPDTGVATNRDIQVKLINGRLTHNPNTSPQRGSLRYPALFPTGAPGLGLEMAIRAPPRIALDEREAYWQMKNRKSSTYLPVRQRSSPPPPTTVTTLFEDFKRLHYYYTIIITLLSRHICRHLVVFWCKTNVYQKKERTESDS